MLNELQYEGIECMTLKELKDHLSITSSDDDALLTSMLTTARSYVEQSHDVAIVTRTLSWHIDNFPGKDILFLPVWPVQSVVITYVDGNGDSQTLSSSLYRTDFKHNPARVEIISGWPGTDDIINAVTVTIVAGFDKAITVTTGTDVVNLTAHGLNNGNRVRFKSTNTLPAPINHQNYYIVNKSDDTFKVAYAPGDTAIDITSTGVGTHYIDLVPEEIKRAIAMRVYRMYDKRDNTTDKVDDYYMQPYRNEIMI